jgi:cleavage and polyadenylation specificity factor subunit 1
MADQEFGHQIENPNLSSVEIHQTDSVDEFQVRIL